MSPAISVPQQGPLVEIKGPSVDLGRNACGFTLDQTFRHYAEKSKHDLGLTLLVSSDIYPASGLLYLVSTVFVTLSGI